MSKKNNSTLIVPAAGGSSRYPNMRPKWLLTHPDGTLMIEKVLNNFDFHEYKKTFIVLLSEHCQKFNADIILNQIFGNSIDLIILENKTSCCPETILKAIEIKKIEGRIVIKDTDCLVKLDKHLTLNSNFIAGMSVDENTKISNLQNKSFIVKNKEDIVVDIIEKSIVSDVICLGVYSLESKDFINSYIKLKNTDVMFDMSEIYMSHIVADLIINEQKLFYVNYAIEYLDWGTIEEWNVEREKFKTYIFDIDGVVLENYGKHGLKNWNNAFVPIEENVQVIKELSDAGCEIIFMTARTEKYLEKFKKFLIQKEINYKTIISGCNHSQRIIVNDFANSNPYPSCKSISINRNGNLKKYIK